MRKRLVSGFVFAAMMAIGLGTQTVLAADQEVAALCYTFPGGITVCCDAGGCYIKSSS